MKWLLAVVFVGIELGGAFGVASADAAAVSSGELEATVSVTVGGSPVGVVVHFIDPGDDQVTATLAHQGGGEYEGSAIIERADLVVVFEAIGPGGTSELSRPATLTELGVDAAILLDGADTGVEEDPAITLDAATERWGWAALGLGAAALSMLAWWALADYPKRRRSADQD